MTKKDTYTNMRNSVFTIESFFIADNLQLDTKERTAGHNTRLVKTGLLWAT